MRVISPMMLSYVCEQNEVKLNTCIYDLATGEFYGLKTELAFIVLRGDSNEIFFSYGFDSGKAAVLYSTPKQKIPDAFVSTSFKKHYSEIINERREKEEYSALFYYLPSITDRKEEVNQHPNNVNLSPVDSRMLKSLAGCLTEFSASDFYWIFFSFRLFFYILTSLSISRVFSSGFLGRPKSFCLDIPRTIIKCDYLN